MNKRIERQVEDLLCELAIHAAPVSLTKVTKYLGLQVRTFDLGLGVSGALLLEDGKAVIGLNPAESKLRRRFTIAHEIGHFRLHYRPTALFVDKKVLLGGKELNGEKVFFRDINSSSGEIKRERDANAFAASLLMPVSLLQKEIDTLSMEDYANDEEIIKELSKRFKVSQIAMTYRLTNLGVLH